MVGGSSSCCSAVSNVASRHPRCFFPAYFRTSILGDSPTLRPSACQTASAVLNFTTLLHTCPHSFLPPTHSPSSFLHSHSHSAFVQSCLAHPSRHRRSLPRSPPFLRRRDVLPSRVSSFKSHSNSKSVPTSITALVLRVLPGRTPRRPAHRPAAPFAALGKCAFRSVWSLK